jgi:hypothetical protein
MTDEQIERELEMAGSVGSGERAGMGSVVDSVMKRIGDEAVPVRRMRLRRWIMAERARLIPAGLAAMVLIGALFGYAIFGGGVAMTLADVKAAMAGKVWLHIVSDGGQVREEWTNTMEGKSYVKRFDGDLIYIDDAINERRWYEHEAKMISVDQPVKYPDGKVPEWKGTAVAEYVIGPYEAAAKDARFAKDVERHEDKVDGKTCVRFDLYWKDALEERRLYEQMWADAQTRLPVKVRRRLQTGERPKSGGREWSVGVYDFPEQGPRSLQELGMPAGTPVVKIGEKAPANVKAIEEAVARGRAKYPKNYRSVVWIDEDGGGGTVDIVWKNGETRRRQERYFNMDHGKAEKRLAPPMTAERILEWTKHQTAVQIDMADGERKYLRRNPVEGFVGEPKEPEVMVWAQQGRAMMNSNSWPEEIGWPQWSTAAGAVELVAKDDAECPANCVGVRMGGGTRRFEYYMDPAKDFVLVKSAWWEMREGKWVKTREYTNGSLAHIGDAWTVGEQTVRDFGDEQKNIGASKAIWHVDVMEIGENEFPAGLFDGKKLMEGAKVETN